MAADFPVSEPNPRFSRRVWLAWLLGLLLITNAFLLYFGLTEDAVTVSKTISKEILLWKVRLVDERSTYSILSAIGKLWNDGNYFLFCLVFGFSVVFPWIKLTANGILLSMALTGNRHQHHARFASWLSYLGKWSMLEVFMAALLCVVVKMGDLVRVQLEWGIYLFCAAVGISVINALIAGRIGTLLIATKEL